MKRILNISLVFGVLAAGLCFLYFLIMYFMVANPLSVRRPDLGLNIIMIGAAIWYFRKKNNGYLHFYEGFSIGFLTNLIAAFLTGILIYLFLEFIDIEPFETWMRESKQMLLADRERSKEIMSEEMFQGLISSFEKRTPKVIIWDELIFKQISIIAISLIAMAMRKIKPL